MNELICAIWQRPENRRLIDFQICGVTYPDRRYVIRRPASAVACIEYVDSGCGVICADGRSQRVGAGDAYFLQPGQDQYYYADPDTPWQKRFVNVSGPLLDRLIEGYRLRGCNCFPALDIRAELNDILRLTQTRPGDNTALLVAALTGIFQKMYAQQTDDARSGDPVRRIRDHLDRTASGQYDFAQACSEAALSPGHCARLFRQAYGVTPHAYFMARKLELAASLLRDTRLPVRAIAHELSFADEYYFSNVFRRKTGLSPRAYRQNSQRSPET